MVYVMFDTTQSIGLAAIRASGNQKVGSIVTGSAYWVIGIPLSLVLCFGGDFGIKGIWIGCTSAVLFNTLAYSYIVGNMDWPKTIFDAEVIRLENNLKRSNS